ncbi:MAG: BREX-1 system adenine-specific DNA-methyltransferase PglX [Alphaproteobacteria bacterium]|nr:BREX-1 system adenine-specific DNA-methyltransferase PglX [Alphaproteobacteria bacterium]
MSTDKAKNFFRVSAEDFKKIPGNPIVYWLSRKMLGTFEFPSLSTVGETREGVTTANNDIFLKFWFEVSLLNIAMYCVSQEVASQCLQKWFPHHKGGEYRKWYGNIEYVINWQYGGKDVQNYTDFATGRIRSHNYNLDYNFKEYATWSRISSENVGLRYSPLGFIFDSASAGLFLPKNILKYGMGLICSCVAKPLLHVLNPTIKIQPGDVAVLPFCKIDKVVNEVTHIVDNTILRSKSDWDSYETSWDFQENPLIVANKHCNTPGAMHIAYLQLRCEWQQQTEEMRKLEIENNRIFIDAYGLQDELSPEVPWNEITLTCNPWYRYGQKIENYSTFWDTFAVGPKDGVRVAEAYPTTTMPINQFPFVEEPERRLLEDTVKEFISYAVGCMMGRYSPEKPGLILANQGDGFDDYASKLAGMKINLAQESIPLNSPDNWAKAKEYLKDATWYGAVTDAAGKQYSLIADRDGVLPILDDEWFSDDIVGLFKQFLKFTFGMEHFRDNLEFIEKALGKDIRKYFIKDFYKDHVQRYKKRPIYWMFSSPKGSFNTLIYMHRYQPDTISIVLNDYLREFMTKLRTHREHLISENNRADIAAAQKTKNMKQIDKYSSMLAELEDYERDTLFPLAQEKISIDLDDGVKVNYLKFGDALKKIPGLEAKETD